MHLCDFDMKCDICNKLRIVVCEFSAVKGFKQKFETVFMCACLPYTSLQFRMCDVNIKLLFHEVKTLLS